MSTTTATNGTAHAILCPDTTTSGESLDATTLPVYQPYRPVPPSVDAVNKEIEGTFGSILYKAVDQASEFIRMVRVYDCDAPDEIRFAHLADAKECMEIAFTYLSMWQNTMSLRIAEADRARYRLAD